MKKKAVCLFIAALLGTVPVFAHPPISVKVDGKDLAFKPAPVIENDRTLVPMRGIFEALGAELIWNEPEQLVTAVSKNDVLFFRIGDKKLYKNGKLIYTMDVPAKILNDRTFIPLRAVSESLGAGVQWDGKAYRVDIYSDGKIPENPKEPEKPAEPVKPEKPEKPVKPAEPAKPTEPAKPAEPTKPVQPEKPAVTPAVKQDAPVVGGFYEEVKAPDGTVLLTAKIKCDVLPVSLTENTFKIINEQMANETFRKGKGFVKEYEATALSEYQKMGSAFIPYVYSGEYKLERKGGGYASYFGTLTRQVGLVEEFENDSRTYSMYNGNSVNLNQLVTDSPEALETLWRNSFQTLINEAPGKFYSDVQTRLASNLKNVRFYLTPEGIVFYLEPGVLAPPSAGTISFEIKTYFG